MKYLVILCSLFLSTQLQAQGPSPQSPSLDILQKISDHNRVEAEFVNRTSSRETTDNVRPFAEYEKTGYVFFNDDDYYGYASEIKRTIAKNLPTDVKLVVYTTSSSTSEANRIRNEYRKFIDASQLIVLKVPRSGSNDFWTRDNLPVPVYTNDKFTLVDAKYYYNFEPDEFLANLFATIKTSHNFFFEGGNFIANSRGECIVVNRRKSYPGGVSDTAAIPDSIFRNQYGCKTLTRFKHLKGIGHADEVVKFMSDDIIVTDTHEYVETLENLGYEVHLLPEPDRRFETYVNALQVNDVLFVPSFDERHDSKAVEIFKSLNLGLKVITIPTRTLATRGQGGIHCITMNYPDVPLPNLMERLQ